jgi:hypothetical protein
MNFHRTYISIHSSESKNSNSKDLTKHFTPKERGE